jgi:hypothetical protein
VPEDQELTESAEKISAAKAAAAEEKESRPFRGEDEDLTPAEPPQNATDEGFSPT